MALEIVQILASGTYGHVAVVRDGESGQLMAAKVLRAAHLSNTLITSRLKDEAALLSRLRHPNIVSLHAWREIEGRPVLLLEWIRGAPLNALLARSPEGLRPAEACEIVRLTATALHAAYTTRDPISQEPIRLIHRDVKPSNILVSVDGEVKLVDFGIAQGSFIGKESETVSVVLGAQGYLAPERLDGADDHPSGDVFALGLVFIELLTGRRMELSLSPEKHAEFASRILMQIRPTGVSPRLVSELTEIAGRMVAYQAEDRPSHRQLVGYLNQLQQRAGWQPDLPRLADRLVLPHLSDVAQSPVQEHKAYPHLAFIETPTGKTPPAPPPREADANLRQLLSSPGWASRIRTLKRELAIDPSWTPAPFLEALSKLKPRRGIWPLKRWSQERRVVTEVVAILEALQLRPSEDVRRVVSRYRRHPDPEVADLAQRIYAAA